MQIGHYIGILLVLISLALVALYSIRNVNASSFGGYKTSGAFVVSGALMGTLVGGSSTIGTAQLAFSYGFSAWWFTLGGGIGVLALAILISRKMYNTEVKTLPEILEKEYGRKNAALVTVLNSMGTFLSVVAQIISAMALISTVSSLGSIQGIIFILVLVIVYVLFGGALSIGYAGVLKTILLSASVLICGGVALYSQRDVSVFFAVLEKQRYFNVFARGLTVDLGAGISLLVGVITTQSYISAILMAKDIRELRKGTLFTALIVPMIGVAGIVVGLYMRVNYPDIESKTALPYFIMEKMPPVLGGLMLGTLLLAVIGTAAGLTFGMAKMIYRNYLSGISMEEVKVERCIIMIILVAAAMMSYGGFASFILSWSFMSMGLRGSTAFIPMITAMLMPGRISRTYVTAAIIAGPVFTLVGKLLLPASVDPLFMGLFIAFLIVVFAIFKKDGNK